VDVSKSDFFAKYFILFSKKSAKIRGQKNQKKYLLKYFTKVLLI
jgi:hypothetical protein